MEVHAKGARYEPVRGEDEVCGREPAPDDQHVPALVELGVGDAQAVFCLGLWWWGWRMRWEM